MMSKINYRCCAVPNCKNTSKSAPSKLFIHLPREPHRRKIWLQITGRNPDQLSPRTTHYLCEDHFDLPNDMENYMEYKLIGIKKIIMKKNCIPTRFECLPDHKTVDPNVTTAVVLKRQKLEFLEEMYKSCKTVDEMELQRKKVLDEVRNIEKFFIDETHTEEQNQLALAHCTSHNYKNIQNHISNEDLKMEIVEVIIKVENLEEETKNIEVKIEQTETNIEQIEIKKETPELETKEIQRKTEDKEIKLNTIYIKPEFIQIKEEVHENVELETEEILIQVKDTKIEPEYVEIKKERVEVEIKETEKKIEDIVVKSGKVLIKKEEVDINLEKVEIKPLGVALEEIIHDPLSQIPQISQGSQNERDALLKRKLFYQQRTQTDILKCLLNEESRKRKIKY